ncbi:MAG: peptidoglycan-binding protein, partial [Minisyncoccia bacterium]
TAITWTASSASGVAPVVYLWGNGATTTAQTVSVTPGMHTISLQVTDASSTVATTTCSATVASSTGSTGGAALSQIQALLNQINALKAQIAQIIAAQMGGGTNATSTPNGCYGFWRDLKRGDNGDDVKELQQQLAHSDPTLFPPGLVNGLFGPKTEAALKMLQKRFDIDASGTGFFGSKSRGHFAAKCSQGDSDKDGIRNSEDSDDDNDGVSDMDDTFPFNSNATSTKMKKDNSGKGKGKGDDKKDNRGSGNSDDDDSDE